MAKFITTTLMDSYAGGPHITETQIGLANQATFGPDDYVLGGGRESEAQVLTNNSIRIFDAVYCIQGRRDVIPASGYTDVTIANGTQGMNRNDIIVRRYKKDESSEIESTEYAVIKGTPNAGEAVDPEVTIGDIRTGATLHEMKLYRVKIKGLNITAVEPLFNILKNMAVLQQEIAQTNKDLSNKLGNLGQSAAIGQYGSAWNVGTSYQNVGSKLPAVSNDLYETVSGNDAVIKIKKPGTYLLLASSEFGTNAGVGGTVWNAIVLESGTEITRSCAYVYGGSATTVISHMLQVESSITIKLCSARSAGSGTIQNKGKDLLQCIKIL